MLLTLQRYDFQVRYRRGQELYIADTLSRTFIKEEREVDALRMFEQVSSIEELFGVSDELLSQVAEHTRRDAMLQDLKRCILEG